MGPAGSDNWHAMLDGAQDVLREEGHAALTSRRVAERVGVKQRLIYYYFRTMDELVVALFERLSERELARLRRAADSELPLREIWNVCVHTADARLVTEFMALASRIEALRAHVTFFIEESRRIQMAAIERAAARADTAKPLSADGLALLATSLALSLTRESQIGVDLGHASVRALVDRMLDLYEPR